MENGQCHNPERDMAFTQHRRDVVEDRQNNIRNNVYATRVEEQDDQLVIDVVMCVENIAEGATMPKKVVVNSSVYFTETYALALDGVNPSNFEAEDTAFTHRPERPLTIESFIKRMATRLETSSVLKKMLWSTLELIEFERSVIEFYGEPQQDIPFVPDKVYPVFIGTLERTSSSDGPCETVLPALFRRVQINDNSERTMFVALGDSLKAKGVSMCKLTDRYKNSRSVKVMAPKCNVSLQMTFRKIWMHAFATCGKRQISCPCGTKHYQKRKKKKRQ